jgi:PIN domain nuclease of toxin-antitoxin system
MKYLIDTQIIIWALISPNKISANVRDILQNNAIYVSQISLFEIAIKKKINKLPEFSMSINETINRLLEDGFEILPLKDIHLVSYDVIPLLTFHKDPFDRLILATALSESIPIISADENFKFYSSQIILIENK